VGGGPSGVVLAEGTLWVTLGHEDTLSRINPQTGREVGPRIATGDGPNDVALVGGDLWVTNFFTAP